MSDKGRQRCGGKFRGDGPFVTCPDCRRPDLVPRSGCRRYYADNPLFGPTRDYKMTDRRPKRSGGG